MTEQAVRERVLERVLELTARHLGHPPGEVGADRSFVALGADSLQLIGMVRQLEAEFGTELTMREILEEAGTPRLAARLIAGRTAPERADTAAPADTASPVATDAPADTDAGHVCATRAEVEELSRQIQQLAETQAAMLTQLSDAVALLTRSTGVTGR